MKNEYEGLSDGELLDIIFQLFDTEETEELMNKLKVAAKFNEALALTCKYRESFV